MINFLTRVLFESLPWLLFFCGVAVVVAVAVHRTRGTRASRRGIWITLAVCAALVVLQKVVVTDHEALEQVVRTMARAVDQGDVGTIGEYIDTGFRLGNDGRDEFLGSVSRTLEVYQVDEPRIFDVKTKVEGDEAVVTFGAFCDVRHGSDVQNDFPTRWQLHFVRRGGRWLLDRIDQARWQMPIGDSGGNLVPYFR
ncbi:MAG TPA: nuclear transport factor 2 family protein [Phycisphaerae bacterium]|jgi:hypothetical protein|nr:nuclear transport factor 2 family protein [Phycisphaerae bacterium]HOB73511.1 nuclear transport factor 2 family protein [Phycisphaerae bacterium]HOJ54119.1 nuclear transport factor 2 family protein [Phycisphaerae bacterium]HOL25588.1 nuclear transport factor 2 family protein [Phycisphaerae bacterium]HPP20979.1 nuclear transport factor 2 family protein [Phycisphaerae bacterium]